MNPPPVHDRPGDPQQLARLRELVAAHRYEVDASGCAAAMVRRLGPLLTARDLPGRGRAPRPA